MRTAAKGVDTMPTKETAAGKVARKSMKAAATAKSPVKRFRVLVDLRLYDELLTSLEIRK